MKERQANSRGISRNTQPDRQGKEGNRKFIFDLRKAAVQSAGRLAKRYLTTGITLYLRMGKSRRRECRRDGRQRNTICIKEWGKEAEGRIEREIPSRGTNGPKTKKINPPMKSTRNELRDITGKGRQDEGHPSSSSLRNRPIEFSVANSCLYNPDFKPLEFDGFRKEARLNAFTLSPQKWINTTNAIGIVSQSGRYGG